MEGWKSIEDQPYAEYGIQICRKTLIVPKVIWRYAAFKHTHHLADPSDPSSEIIEHIEMLGYSAFMAELKMMIELYIQRMCESGRPDEEDIL